MTTTFSSELDYWCSLTFMLDGGSTQRLYKTITVWDDDLVNPWRSVYLKLKSDDYRVIVPYNYTHAILWIEDNEGTYVFVLDKFGYLKFNLCILFFHRL